MDLDLKCKTPMLFYTDEELNSILKIRGKTLDQVSEDVKIIKEWLKLQPHLPLHPSDRQIVCFLVMNKFFIEKTKEKIDMNYTIKGLMPEFYTKPPSHPDIQKTMSHFTYGLMPKLTKKFNRIYVCRLENADDVILTDSYTYLCTLFEIRTILDFSNSDEYIFDLSYYPLSMLTKVNPMDMKRVVTVIEKVNSNRMAGIHFINMPGYAENLINLIKSMLKPKIRERVNFHKGYKSLLEFFDEDRLPKEFGGSGPTIPEVRENMRKLCLEHDEYIKKIFNAKVNESLRPSKLVNDDILGYHGNFKKLQFIKVTKRCLSFFDEDRLPIEFGGSGPTIPEVRENLRKLCLENDEYIKKIFNAKVDESLRPRKLINDDILGYHGNFKKLLVD
ncbi:PREDICTED: alpha-tocopherol transfer protein-like [Nicrophorus vespilloides]|uniref:Alpha-tocopherol transfer protein-like n=1 Tax=Nicrophorus vespilloides TaxID=110193 RepID=A0ABM1M9C2_NICVS|nr:PREDICTED: alpha-tocopherol transfer protein-like [Nicrophorus vespilloides]